MDFCIKCGHQLNGETGFCGKCGAAIVQEASAKVCPSCHSEIGAELVFCDKCGAKYVPPEPQQYYQAPQSQPQSPFQPQPQQYYQAQQSQPQQYYQTPQSPQQPQQYYQAPKSPPQQQQQYYQAPPYTGSETSSQFKNILENPNMMIGISAAIGIIGLIIAAFTYTFGLGEIMVFGSFGVAALSKKPAGFIAPVVCLIILAIIWFGF